MTDHEHLVAASARVVELAGVIVLLVGAIAAAAAFARRLTRHIVLEQAYHMLRAWEERYCLASSCTVIADIIGTAAIEPTLQNLGVLAVIVAIRTFLSFALELEVSGRWPWQHGEEIRRHAEP